MPPALPPVAYATTTVNGIEFRPDSRAIMEKAVLGHPVIVTSGNDYINLYHVFERMQEANKKLSKLFLVRRQVGRSRWFVFAVSDKADVPEVELVEGYDPKRGRYKRYAEQLAAGETVRVPNRVEAIKARRAWQLYVPSAKRRTLRPRLTKTGRSGEFDVQIVERPT